MRHVDSRAIIAFDFSGIEIHDLTAALETSSASVARIRIPPGARHAPARSHRSDKYYIGLIGNVAFRIGEQSVLLGPHGLLAIEKGEWFAYTNREDDTAELLLVHVPSFDLEAEEFANDAAFVEPFQP